MHWIYFLFIAVGILAVWFAIHQQKRRERFAGAGSAPASAEKRPDTSIEGFATETGGTTTTSYTEDITKLPKASTVQFYLTSFSDLPNYEGVLKVYSGAETKWHNFIRAATDFTMIGTGIPGSIREMAEGEETNSSIGLPLKTIKLVGPSSTLACGASETAAASTILSSFSVMFYGRFNSITFDASNKSIVLFQMFAENPNHIKWSITPKDNANCYIELVLGNTNTTYRWIIPKTTLMSNGNPTLYGLVYSVGSVKRTFTVYVGTNKYTASSTDMTPIRLGYTPMEINSTTNADMILQSFVYMNSVLVDADIPAWSEYFVNQSGGLARTLRFLKDTYASEITTLNNQLTNQTNSVDDLQKALEECRAKMPAQTYEDKKEKWKIQLDGKATDVSTEEAKKCSVLLAPSPWKKDGASKEPAKFVEENEKALKIVSPVPKK